MDIWKVPYILAESPSNLLVKYFKPSVWLARIMVGSIILQHSSLS